MIVQIDEDWRDWLDEIDTVKSERLQKLVADGETLDFEDQLWLARYNAPEKGDISLEQYQRETDRYWEVIDKTLLTEETKAATFTVVDLAFAELLLSHPDLSSAIDDMKVLVSYRHDTVSTDTKDAIYLNPEFVATLKPKEATHCMGFLAWSSLNNTLDRRPEGCDVKKWEAACNLLANRYLIDEHVGRLPTNALFMVGYDHETMTIEQVYAHLESYDLEDIYKNAWPRMARHGELIEGEFKEIRDEVIAKVMEAKGKGDDA